MRKRLLSILRRRDAGDFFEGRVESRGRIEPDLFGDSRDGEVLQRRIDELGFGFFDPMTIDELREHLLQAPIVRCDEVAWSLFSISMAGYNVLTSLALAGSCLWLALTLAQRTAPD